MYYIDPIAVTDAHILPGTTLAEDTTPAWTAGTYTIGDERHVVATHRVYKCALAGESAVSPELDPQRWKDMRPTNRSAPFDIYSNTQAKSSVADITYVLRGRFVNALMLRGLAGKDVFVTVKNAPGGDVIYPTKRISLRYPARGYWDYAFGQRRLRTHALLTGLPIAPNAEITITVSAVGANPRAIGLIALGKLRALHGNRPGPWGTQTGPEAAPKTYTYRKTLDDGTQITVPRSSSKDVRFDVLMPESEADRAVQDLESLLSKPVGVIATTKAGFGGLQSFGYVTKSPVTYRNGHAVCQIFVEGIV